MKKIFRLLLVSFALSACGTKPTIETTPTQKDVYTLNANNVTVEVIIAHESLNAMAVITDNC